jgi:tetratricopeptide (TPR) repeat protein
MQDFIRHVMRLHDVAQHDNAPSAIFGTASSLNRSLQRREPIRVGIWPCVSDDTPEVGMGLMSALLYLLDSWRDVRVYPLLVKEKHNKWQVTDSQFEVEDFEPVDLDENVAMWGKLQKEGDQWTVTLEIENDMIDSEETTEYTYSGDNLAALVNQLPQMAQDITKDLDASTTTLETFTPTEASGDAIKAVMQAVSDWQAMLCLTLWDKNWSSDIINAKHKALIDAGKAAGDFGAWITASATAHSNLPGYDDINIDNMEHAVIQAFPAATAPPIILARSIFWYDVQGAYRIMENAIEEHPTHPGTWLTLADLYRQGGRVVEMIDTYQRAIEEEATNALLYSNYAVVLELISEEELIEEYVLIDPDEYYDSYPMWEAVAAYEEARKLEPESVGLLQRQLLIRFDVSEVLDDKLIQDFKSLVERDKTGNLLRPVAESLELIDDVDPLLDILEEAVETDPKRVDLRVNLAVAFIAVDDNDLAIEELKTADELNDDPEVEDEIAHLLLSAEDPEFEARMGEIGVQVEAGARINNDDIDFLEDIIERAPTLAEGYVLLGKSYRSRDENEAALECLLDGHKHNPEYLDIMLLLGQMLWEAGEAQTAFEYLNKGLTTNPNYVPLLALTGQYLFEDGQDDAAKTYLARAEAISPRNPMLARAKRTIADIMSRR